MDKTRFIELLQKQKVLADKGQKLMDSELTDYEIILSDQDFYENRLKYIDLVKNCLDVKINC